MTAGEAKIIAQQVNAPKLEQWLEENPLNKIISQIRSASSEGFYGIEYALPRNTPTFALMYVMKKFTELGYEISFKKQEDENNETVLYRLTIEWDEA